MTPFSGFSYPPPTSSPSDAWPDDFVPLVYWTIANESLSEKGLSLSDDRQLKLIIHAGLEARSIFFAALTHDPTQQDLDLFFMDFVIRCVTPIEPTETR